MSLLTLARQQCRQTLRMLKYSRAWSSEAHAKTEGEIKLGRVLSEKFPKASFIHVEDISGGCGAMYDIQIEAEEFAGKRTIEQHRMINKALAEEIKDMHGLRINTRAPKK